MDSPDFTGGMTNSFNPVSMYGQAVLRKERYKVEGDILGLGNNDKLGTLWWHGGGGLRFPIRSALTGQGANPSYTEWLII